MRDFDIAMQRLERLSVNEKTPQAVAGDLGIVLLAARQCDAALRENAALEAKAQALDKLEEMLESGWDVKTIYKRGDKRHVWVETGCGETYRKGRGTGPNLVEAILSASKGVEENQ